MEVVEAVMVEVDMEVVEAVMVEVDMEEDIQEVMVVGVALVVVAMEGAMEVDMDTKIENFSNIVLLVISLNALCALLIYMSHLELNRIAFELSSSSN